VQLPQALGCHIDLGEGHAGDVPAWPIEIGNEARSDGVGANHEDDRDGSRRRLGCLYSVAVADYDGHLSINQICRELRKPLVLTVRPAVLDYNILAFHESCFLQAALERSHQVRRVIERSNPKKPDHRHRPLLRTRRKRPSRCTPEQQNEIASSHCLPRNPCLAFNFDHQNTKGCPAKWGMVRQGALTKI
jgi:hypothetical protein